MFSHDERITTAQDEVGQPSDLNVEEADVVVGATVGVNHLDSIGPRVLPQAQKLCGMSDGAA